MVTSVGEEDRPEPWLQKKKPVAQTRRETRTAAKACAGNDKRKEPEASNLLSGSGRGRRQGKAKVVERAKGLKRTKTMPAAAVDVVLGQAENPVRSVEELSRKIEEDARACGRITRKISHPATRTACPTTASDPQGGEANDDRFQPINLNMPQKSPYTSAIEVSGGMSVNCWHCILLPPRFHDCNVKQRR